MFVVTVNCLFMILIAIDTTCASTAPIQEETVSELIYRTVGHFSSAFDVTINSTLTFRSFEISTTNEKINIHAYDGISAAKGFHYYLKHILNKSVYWYNDRIEIATSPIIPNITILSQCESSVIYYQNVCAWGYSYVWWSWSTWIKHIDWMAMMGISLTIAPIQELFWYETYLEMGLTEDEINDHLSGPAFLPWIRMGNIRGWAGPIPFTFRRMQVILQRKIIHRQRAFGMKVAVPAFSGYVPTAMKRLFPNISFVVADPWNNFPKLYCCSLYLNSFEPLYKEIAYSFLRKVVASYGTDHIYFADPFNEMQPESSDPTFLSMTARYIFASMHGIDNKANWLLQGWMFINNKFWSKNQIKAFLTAVPKGRILVLDLQSEQFPQYENTNSFYGQPFIWCMLHNFGGTLGMHGSADVINRGIRIARSIPNSSMVGVGITPEGINQNYVMYALTLERAWLKGDINLTRWFNTYSDVRYGVIDSRLREAWQLLRISVYSYYGYKKIHGKYIITRRPSTRLNVWTWYNVSNIYISWARMLECNNTIPHNYYNEYKHDLVDISRQFLQTISDHIYVNLMYSFKMKKYDQFEHLASSLLNVFTDLEDILATNRNFLLGIWIEGAKNWSTTFDEEELYQFNALNQITLWGPTGEIVDYATKQWSGIVKDFFQPRWKLFLDYLRNSLYENRPFNTTIFNKDVFRIVENPFNYQRKKYTTEEHGDTYNSSKRIYHKWINFLTNNITKNIFQINVEFYKEYP